MTTACALLEAARILIEDEQYWTGGNFARDQNGFGVNNPTSPDAVRWCAVGAIRKYGGWGPDADYAIRVLEICRPHHAKNVFDVNDRLGHEAVLKMYDDAIATFHR